MKLGLISDTHGELENLREALRQLIQIHKIEKVIHLGDEWEDTEVFKEIPGIDSIVVPGIYARQYLAPTIPNRVICAFHGWQVLFSHTATANDKDLPGDPDPQELASDQKIDVIACGHTHIPAIEEKNYVLVINPGHLKTKDKKGHSPSYAVLDIRPDKIEASIVDLYSKETFNRRVFTKKKITIQTADLKLKAVLNNTQTAQKVWDALPIEGKANLWGEEIYFSIPIEAELENGQEIVHLGDIGYWPPGKAICFFFGPTPVSAGEEIRPYSLVTVIGKLVDNPKELKVVRENDIVTITTHLW